MGSREANIENNNLGARRLSIGCYTSIPTYLVFHSIIKFHYVLNLQQIIFYVFVCPHSFFGSPQSFPYFGTKGRKVVGHTCRFHCEGTIHFPAIISIMYCYPMVSLINFPISWRYGVIPRLITLCSERTYSRIGLLHIFSNVVGTLIVQNITLPPQRFH